MSKKLIAENIYHISSSPAPKEWEEIPEIKKKRPSPIGQEVSLQRLDNTNICIWYTRKFVSWNPASDPFVIESLGEEKETYFTRINDCPKDCGVCGFIENCPIYSYNQKIAEMKEKFK